MSIATLILHGSLEQLITLLTDDQIMVFNKTHVPIERMDDSSLLLAIELVERTLENSGVDYVFQHAIIKENDGRDW